MRAFQRMPTCGVCLVLLVALLPSSFSATLPLDDESSFAGETVTRVGKCDHDHTLAEISFPGDNGPLITVCHDEETDFTLWSKHIFYGNVNDGGSGNRPSFKEGGFYPNISADDCYKQVGQTETIGMLLGSTSLAQHYIQTGKNLFLARGHYAPNADPTTVAQKDATFYFINASPQWQTVNGGNWNLFEQKLRSIARAAKSTLTIWTGSHGVTTLKDENNNPVEIWLGRTSQGALVKKLPVNHLTWKVIHDPATRTGVAIIMINNPWIERVTPEDVICDDVCDQLTWISWNKNDITNGYTYCCTVASFKEKVDYAPDLGDLPLMKSL